MSDDETRPIEPEAPAPPPPAARPPVDEGAPPAYAMPVPAGYPAGYPGYAAPQQRPRFADQVLGMRAVIAVALACLIIGGLSGFILGRASADHGDGFGGPDGFFQQRGAFPNGAPNGTQGQPFGQGQGR